MRKVGWFHVITGFALASLLSLPAMADTKQQTAVPGTLNYVEGQASIGNETLNSKSIGSSELEAGQSLDTGAGKAEILLTPGVFLRLGDNAAARMISPSIINTQVELTRGEATVEVADLHRENDLQVVEDGKATQLVKNGLYEFNADSSKIRVFDGQADFQNGRKLIKIKGGHELDFASGDPLKAVKFDKKTYEASDLYRWTSLRSSYLAEANADAAQTYIANGGGWFGDGWYWDPWFSAYTWIPGDGMFYSPFGWGFYSPAMVWAAPGFYGGYHYYHNFGPNYRAWGPGVHYGMPQNYGHGVHYGAHPSMGGVYAAGPRNMGGPRAFGGGQFGGGFHGFGGFHGGGGVRR